VAFRHGQASEHAEAPVRVMCGRGHRIATATSLLDRADGVRKLLCGAGDGSSAVRKAP
jgi:hypothetical protein